MAGCDGQTSISRNNIVDQFIDEQVEEEKTVRDILNLFRHRDGHTVATIDDIVGSVKE